MSGTGSSGAPAAEHGSGAGSEEARRRVVVTGVGLLSPLGESRGELLRALLAGEERFTEGAPEGAPEGCDAGCPRLGSLDGAGPERHLTGNLRPLDRTSRLAAAAVELALADAGWDRAEAAASGLGLVLGTMFGSVRTIAEFDRRALEAGPNYVKPFDFANSVINAAAGQAAIWHRLEGINATLAGGPVAGLEALGYAADLVRSGRAEAILAGGADELSFEACLGFARSGLTSPTGRPRPFDARRDGFVPAEGAALLLLEEEGAARRRGARVLARLAGSGSGFDPSRGRDPERSAAALAQAVDAALADAGVTPGELAALSAGASGSVGRDPVEAAGVERALGAEVAARLPVAAVKGLLGESLGASGAFQASVLVEAMASGQLPGVPGLETPAEGFALAAASGSPYRGAIPYGLVTAVGFDGAAGAVVLAAAGEAG